MEKIKFLYTVCNQEGRMVAWSEEKKFAKRFVKSRTAPLALVEISNKKIIDNAFTEYPGMNIIHDELIDMYITELEYEVFMEKIHGEMVRVKDTIRNIEMMMDTYTLDERETKKLQKSINHLEDIINVQNFNRIFDVNTIQRILKDKRFVEKRRQ